ncbi:unnamed protein product [Ceratitis capitata]|uniref:(Mediterranean fruit fly) hypothetical protein n=1 Tax=Ceratitis capitata TaxID=7213 RepID=A0A811UDS6_CERCA|nr:unnamed protein product [Ceratitis capitata]
MSFTPSDVAAHSLEFTSHDTTYFRPFNILSSTVLHTLIFFFLFTVYLFIFLQACGIYGICCSCINTLFSFSDELQNELLCLLLLLWLLFWSSKLKKIALVLDVWLDFLLRKVELLNLYLEKNFLEDCHSRSLKNAAPVSRLAVFCCNGVQNVDDVDNDNGQQNDNMTGSNAGFTAIKRCPRPTQQNRRNWWLISRMGGCIVVVFRESACNALVLIIMIIVTSLRPLQ